MLDVLEELSKAESELTLLMKNAPSMAQHPQIKNALAAVKEARHLLEVSRGDRVKKKGD